MVRHARAGQRIAPELMDAAQEAMGGAYFLLGQLVATLPPAAVLAAALATVVPAVVDALDSGLLSRDACVTAAVALMAAVRVPRHLERARCPLRLHGHV
jgi:hypothetical protein